MPLRLETLGTLIFVNPDAGAPPLAEVAAGTVGLLEHGRMLPESERLIAHFQGLVRDALQS